MMARTLSSLSAASKASISSCCMVPLKALSLAGRFSVIVRICSATSYLIVSYAIGCFPLVLLLLLRIAQGLVMPGLVPAIHVFSLSRQSKNVDGRDKPGHDETLSYAKQ